MDSLQTAFIQSAELVLPAAALDETLAFFTGQLGFRVVSVYPADDPQAISVEGHGLRLQLNRNAAGDPGTLRLVCLQPDRVAGGARGLVAPNGTRIDIIDADPPLVLPPLQSSLVVTRAAAGAVWHAGRAGLFYRDLLPDRLGGRYIASHIRIADAGPVADYVHFHKVQFQMIFCRKGWVRVVYEDQGEPFVMQEGDCVLQPPRIRHRVLESSAALEVVEVSCPALHETFADPALQLPNPRLQPQRLFGGQRFVRLVASGARWVPWRAPGFESRDLGIGAATAQLASARVVRSGGATSTPAMRHDGDFLFFFVLNGSTTLHTDAGLSLVVDDCCSIPAGMDFQFASNSPDLELLEVALPGQPA
ncbi:MAG: cupin domain-containing protein [Burkholderiaceae bacterium]